MSNHLDRTLPVEILKRIFEYVSKTWHVKEDIDIYLSVCKTWRVAAEDIFREMTISVYEDSLERLSRDIVYFAQKVKSIRLFKSNSIDRTVTCLVWFNIILACPNLISVKINVNDDANYVQCLLMNTATERLSHIQYFETPTPQLRLELNLKFCKTITSLLVTSESFCENNSVSGLIKFISLFPKVTSFKLIMNYYSTDPVDIIQFLEAAPQLQFLDIYFFSEVNSILRTTSMDLCLTVLMLEEVGVMDVDSLIFITSGLRKLNKLVVDINNLSVADSQQERFGAQNFNAEELFNDLIGFTSRISWLFLSYRYQDVQYILKDGKEPRIIQVNNDLDDYVFSDEEPGVWASDPDNDGVDYFLDGF